MPYVSANIRKCPHLNLPKMGKGLDHTIHLPVHQSTTSRKGQCCTTQLIQAPEALQKPTVGGSQDISRAGALVTHLTILLHFALGKVTKRRNVKISYITPGILAYKREAMLVSNLGSTCAEQETPKCMKSLPQF